MSKSIAEGALVSFIGGALGRGFRYSLNIAVGRFLGPTAVGILAFGIVITQFSSMVSRLGLDNAAQRFIPKYSDEPNRQLGVVFTCIVIPFVLGTILAAVVYISSETIATHTQQNLAIAFKYFSFAIPFASLLLVSVGITKGFKTTRYEVLSRDLGQSGVAIILVLISIKLTNDFKFIALSYALSFAIGSLIAISGIARRINFDNNTPEFQIRKLLVFSTPLLAIAMISYLMTWTDILMLSFLTELQDVGRYFVAYQTSMLLLMVLNAANGIFPSVASHLYSKNKLDELNNIYSIVTKWVVKLTLFGYAFIIIFRFEFLTLFGEGFDSVGLLLVIMCTGQLAITLSGPAGFYLMMTNRERLDMINTIAISVLNVLLNYVLILSFGLVGAAVATVISISLLSFVRVFEVYTIDNINPYKLMTFGDLYPVFISIVMMILLSTTQFDYLSKIAISLMISTLTLVIFQWLVGIDNNDMRLIESIN